MLAAGNAIAALPQHSDICDHGRVDKQRLALFALDNAGVSRNPERWAQEHPEGFETLTPLQRVIVDEEFCTTTGTSTGGAPKCTTPDRDRLPIAFETVLNLLRPNPAFRSEGGATSPRAFFANPAAQLICVTTADGQEVPLVPTPFRAPGEVSRLPLRIRGSTDGLQFARNDSAFAGLERATISFKDDNEAGKETFKLNAIVGLALFDRIDLQAVPYFGFTRDWTRRDGQARDTSTDIVRLGVMGSHLIRGRNAGHVILFRPEYLTNRLERSEVISANLNYVPRLNGRLNDAIMIRSGGRDLFSIIPRLDLRLSAGHFIDPGSRLPENSEDFVRVGVWGGFSILSDIPWLPAELTVTETYLHGLSGNPGHLSQFRAILSLAFDKKKYFGLDLGYVRGRREDLAPRENVWSIAFGARF